jgi:phosphoglycolate phosphatase
MSAGAAPRSDVVAQAATRRVKAAVIDLDGTMVDTADDFTASLNGMLAEIGARPVEREEVVGYVGKGSEHLVRSVLSARFSAEETAARFGLALDRYQAHYGEANGRHTRLYPEVEPGLAALARAGLTLACVTNKPHRFAVALLEQYGLARYFSVILGGDSVARKKPDPLPMLAACDAMGVAPADAVAIGDSENDALAGRAAGMATLTVPYGYNHGKAIQTINSDGIVATLLEAARFIANLSPGSGATNQSLTT